MAAEESLSAEQVAHQVEYWLDLAEYDMATARTMLTGGHLLYVGFMCHQVVEKALKAVFTARLSATPPFIHALVKLAQLAQVYDEMTDDQRALLIALQPMNVECRYPSVKAALLSSLSPQRCQQMLDDTGELWQWIKERSCSL
jgi:HEPN domain-containing protein